MNDKSAEKQGPTNDPLYADMLRLDELESLRDELSDLGLAEHGDLGLLPAELRQRMRGLGVHSVSNLDAAIAELHRRLDEDDTDFE